MSKSFAEIARHPVRGFAIIGLVLLAVACAISNAQSAPTITSDKPDYFAGETVTLTGTGWIPTEVVHIVVNDDAGQTWRHEAEVTADADGVIVDDFTLPDWFVATYSVTATGPLSGTATTTFTDGPLPNNVSLKTWKTVTTGEWINGTLQANNSDYKEGETVPFRLEAGTLALSGNPYTAPICRDYQLGSGVFGYTTLQPFNTSRAATAGGTISSTSGPFSGVNLTITNVNETGTSSSGSFNCGSTARLTIVTFDVISASSSTFLLWGGRLAAPTDPGVGETKSATFWTGGSLQMRLASPDKASGIQPSAVVRLAKITVQKIVDSGSATPDQWCFNISPNPNNETLPKCPASGTDTVTFLGLPTGNYQVTETNVASYAFASGGGTSCTFSGSTATASVTASQNPNDVVNATCIFHNAQQQGTAIVKKVMVGGTDTFSYTGTPSGSISTNNGTISANVVPAQYQSTETVPAGWDLTSITCDDGNSSGNVGTAKATFNVANGETVTCTFTNTKEGTIIVRKETNPDADPAVFNFTSNLDGDDDESCAPDTTPAAFSLSDGQQEQCDNLNPAGTYDVSETVPTGWDLTSINCTSSLSDPADTDGQDLDLDPGETITCTFTNEKDATVTITKDAIPNSTQDFAYTTSGAGLAAFTLDDDGTNATGGGAGTLNEFSNSKTFTISGTDFGAHSITETVPTGWANTAASCSEGTSSNSTVSFAVDPGDAITCTFTNKKDAKVTVTKDADPADGTDFDFSGSFGVFSLDEGGTADAVNTSETFTVSDTGFGSKTITETGESDWQLTDIDCNAAAGASNETLAGNGGATDIAVDPGDAITCTFTNKKDAKVTVTKDADPADGTDFDFSGSFGVFSLDEGGTADAVNTSETFTVSDTGFGSKTITETGESDWQLTDIDCNAAAGASGETLAGNGGATDIAVDPGDQITCTFTNKKDAKVTVTKDAVPNSTQDFAYTTSGAGLAAFTLDDDGTNATGGGAGTPNEFSNSKTFTISGTDFGAHSITETVPTGWDNTATSCSQGTSSNSTVSFTVDPGDTITCNYENTKRATIIVKKVMVGGTATFTYSGTPSGSISANNGTIQASEVAGTYQSTETVPTGWDLNSISCDDGSSANPSSGNVDTATATFKAEVGETVTCTFTNTKRGKIIVVKQTHPDGSSQSFEFDPSYGPNFSLTDGQQNDSGFLLPGTYSVAEVNIPSGWVLANVTTSDGSPATALSLEAGETLTATFTDVRASNFTNTSFCPLPNDQFRLLSHMNTVSPTTYRLQASNPGQFYYNVFHTGTPGDTVTLSIEIPYPFVTQEGAGVPIQVHGGVTLNSSQCLVPSPRLDGYLIDTVDDTLSSSGNPIITFADYSAAPTIGISTTTVTISGVVPTTGLLYVTIHLDYGLKKTIDWSKGEFGGASDALDARQGSGSSAPTILNGQTYNFSFSGSGTFTSTPTSVNEFKRFAGFMGFVQTGTGDPVASTQVVIYKPDGGELTTLTTDADGFYFYEYKHKAKSATYKIRLPAHYPGVAEQSITIKANGFAVVNFEVPVP